MTGIFKKFKIRNKKTDDLSRLCQLYLTFPENADGYWVVSTEIEMYELLKKRLKFSEIEVQE